MTVTARVAGETIDARLNFTGPIEGRPRYDLVDFSRSRINLVGADVSIADARPIASALSMDKQGFEIISHKSETAFLPEKSDLERHYFPEMAEVFKSRTGARDVLFLRNGLIRRKGGTGTLAKSRPAHFVHLDYTARSARNYVDIAREWAGIDSLKPFSRYAIFQCWRPLTRPPHDEPLALADARTVRPQDTVAFDTILDEGESVNNFESRWVRHNADQKWYYFSNVTPEEVIIFKGFDSDPAKPCDVAHSAFIDSRLANKVPPRENVELRMLAIFD